MIVPHDIRVVWISYTYREKLGTVHSAPGEESRGAQGAASGYYCSTYNNNRADVEGD